ncbi:MAG TPA: hypothetical protein VGH49_21250 [Xanthobacteraceae bacterium]|jgi:hypothetical protein
MKSQNLARSAPSEPCDEVRDIDIVAMLPMLDYLIAEISRVDLVAAHHLMSARETLAESVAFCVIRSH